MFSRRIAIGAVAVGASAAAVLGATTAYAATATAVNITAGSAASGTTVNFSAVSGAITLKDLNTNITGSCTASTLSGGTVKTGSGQNPNGSPVGTGIAQIPGTSSTSTFNTCKAVSNTIPLTITGASASGSPWRVKVDTTSTPTSSTPVNGQTTTGTISNIKVHVVDASSPSSCNFDVTGSISGATFTNGSPSTLAIPAKTLGNSSLTVSNFTLTNGASNCIAGAVSGNGDQISFSTTYNINPTNSAQAPIRVNAT